MAPGTTAIGTGFAKELVREAGCEVFQEGGKTVYGLTSEKLVRDLQVPVEECLLVPADASVGEAAAMLSPSTRMGAVRRIVLVVDDRSRPVGTLSYGDLRAEGYAFGTGKVIDFTDAVRRRGGERRPQKRDKVTRVMRPIPQAAIEGSASLTEAVSKMVANALPLLPVLENGRVTGVIHAGRILEEAARVMGENGDQAVSGR